MFDQSLLVRQHDPADWAVLPGDRAPGLLTFSCDLDVRPVHGSVAVGALSGFRLHKIVYYLETEKPFYGFGLYNN